MERGPGGEVECARPRKICAKREDFRDANGERRAEGPGLLLARIERTLNCLPLRFPVVCEQDMKVSLLTALLCIPAFTIRADEGMWLFDQPPRQLLRERHQFDATDAWLEH